MSMTVSSAGILAVGEGAGTAEADARSLATPRYGAWGFDLSGRDLSVRPGDDFNRYANGTYLAEMKIPADRSRFGSFDILTDLSMARVHAILVEMAARSPADPDTDDEKIGAFYKAFLDENAVEARGVQPLQKDLAAILAANTRSTLAGQMGLAHQGFNGAIFSTSINVDAKDPSTYAVYLGQSGLGMPDRDYYLKPEFADKKAAYAGYVAKILSLISWPSPEIAARDVLAYETQIAGASWAAADRRNPDTTYNSTETGELFTFAPGFDWPAYLAAAKLSAVKRVVVREKTAVPKIAAIFAETPMETLKAWAAFHLADAAAPNLPDRFVQASFEFRNTALSGTPELQARWKRAVEQVGDLRTGMGGCGGKGLRGPLFSPRLQG